MGVPNRGPELQAVGYILVITAGITLLLRCFTRLFIVKSFGLDDWAMLVAMVFFTLFVTCALIGVHYGTGRHADDLTKDHFEKAMMYWWFCYMWYCASMVASKISIGWFLLRITVRKSDIITIWIVLACTVATGMVFFFTTLFQCSPQSYFWNRDQDGKCINIDIIIALTYLYSAFSLVCDFTFALLPVVLIMKLNLKRSHKYALIPIVMMACVASTAVLVRFAYVKDFKNPDFLWATIDIAIWSTTEQGLAITAGSLATLRPLIRLVTSKVSSLYGNRSTNLRASDHPHPPTIGGMGSKHKLNRPHGPFSLITAGRDDDRDLPAGKDIEMPERMWSIEKKSAWTMTRSRVDGASSEEELTAPGKHWDDSHLRTKTVIEAVPRED